MRLDSFILLAGLAATAATLSAQQAPADHQALPKKNIPAVELTLGYTYLHANAPPGSCACFSLNGGYGAVAFNLPRGFSLVGDISGAHSGSVAATNQSISVVNYLFGPRYSWRSGGRFTPYGQFLLGGSTELSSLAAVQHVSAFAFSPGGGVNAQISNHLGWNIGELDWLHSQLPNAVNNRQNDLRVNTGLILRF